MYRQENDVVLCEDAPLKVLAEKYGTPLYVYSLAKIKANIEAIKKPFKKHLPNGLICYAVKANSNRNFIKYMSENGLGFDVVSGGEIKRVLSVQKDLSNCVYSGTAKTDDELKLAIQNNILMLLCESPSEIRRAAELAEELQKPVNIGIRINPYITPKTHKYTDTSSEDTKFGICRDDIFKSADFAMHHPFLNLRGVSCHIGSMIEDVNNYFEMVFIVTEELRKLAQHGIILEYVSFGGGFPITYTDEKLIDYDQLFAYYKKALVEYPNIKVIIEPGRAIVGNAGILISKVLYTKQQGNYNFMFLDAGMTELIRPALYGSIHNVLPITQSLAEPENYMVVGPICESSDVFAHEMSIPCGEGDLLLLENAGAYGFTMSSNYNTRPKAAEVLINGNNDMLITKRQSHEDLWRDEVIFEL